MRNGLTEVVFILDRSGSMAGLEDDTIGGFNAMLKKQQQEEGEALISTILFDDHMEVIHDRADIAEVEPLTEHDYYVGSTTALMDAIGGAVDHIRSVQHYIREEDVPEHTIFIITTDGMENSSCRYDISTVRRMIRRQKRMYGWEFLFLGANIDAEEIAAGFGIDRGHSVNYHSDPYGTRLNYEVLNEAIHTVRSGDELDEEWKQAIEADFNIRDQKDDHDRK